MYVLIHRWTRKQLTLQRNSSLGLSAQPDVPLFTSEVLFQRSTCTCCMPRTCPPPKRSTDLNVAPDVDKAPSSTAFYFRCRSPKRIAIRSPFPSTWTSPVNPWWGRSKKHCDTTNNVILNCYTMRVLSISFTAINNATFRNRNFRTNYFAVTQRFVYSITKPRKSACPFTWIGNILHCGKSCMWICDYFITYYNIV